MKTYSEVYQFKITLWWVKPPVWRRIEVPSNYRFWDLHVAIQDAMGWLDCHLHAFNFKQRNKFTQIGTPDSFGDGSVVPPRMERENE